ncbi:LOW QUALITY PROTEIN: transmembrane amino acid transporter [Microdochium trichocladiopsis]|uniref:Transmembrane amino acid transporter n=1 Tax=Microdochium trichocladiopsis TaxID=1682393 RepID=A0A9P8YKA3_9PEZI|nr:LOW QUALITY PROTEIN: transmembrane amino acid transporter [Microdochium trichocladiopsis]KAH7041512.1 LOW QUALITY PROTEIN: transmembrane amino acid transporter [Microdochium trichocladiopsis]
MAAKKASTEAKYQSSDKTDMAPAASIKGGIVTNDLESAEAHEVFKTGVDGVEFRTVSWQRATIVFCKINFAMSILAIPEAFATLGSVGGSFSLIGFTSLNVYTGLILGDFHNRHPECHMLADMMGLIWGKIGRELVGVQIIIAQVLISAGGIVTTAVGLNALSNHSQCTVVFALLAAILITACSSIRTFSKLGWLTWFGMITFVLGVFVFTIAITQQDRPAAAPPTGDFDLGWTAISYPTFVVGMVSAANLFICTSGSSMFLPVISEMRRPQDYRKACLWAGFIVDTLYLALSLVIYRYCGKWLSVPAFGSAGPLFKKISYGISLPGLIYAFVRLLRDSHHLQKHTVVHWGTWLGVNLALGVAAFIVAEAEPILSYLLGLAGAFCFAPFSLIFPCLLWMYDSKGYRTGSKAKYAVHALIVSLGLFMVVGTAYAVVVATKDAFATGMIARVFDCAANSGSS